MSFLVSGISVPIHTVANREPFLGVILATQKLLIIAHRMLGNYSPADYIWLYNFANKTLNGPDLS